MSIEKLLASVDSELTAIKKECCSGSITHTPGKKLRSQLLIEIFRSISGGYPRKQEYNTVLNACVAIELIHDSSLIIDDIFDKGHMRRGEKTLHMAVGQNKALLIANILLMRAGKILINSFHPASNFSLVQEFFDTSIALASGELKQQQQIEADHIDPETIMSHYEHSVEGKTSSLFILSAILGVLAAKSNLTAFAKVLGSRLGIAFQMKDDFMDIFATKKELGKDVKSDLFIQKLSFPVSYVIAKEKITSYNATYFASYDFSTVRNELQELYHKRCKEVYSLILSAPEEINREVLQAAVEKILAIRFQNPL